MIQHRFQEQHRLLGMLRVGVDERNRQLDGQNRLRPLLKGQRQRLGIIVPHTIVGIGREQRFLHQVFRGEAIFLINPFQLFIRQDSGRFVVQLLNLVQQSPEQVAVHGRVLVNQRVLRQDLLHDLALHRLPGGVEVEDTAVRSLYPRCDLRKEIQELPPGLRHVLLGQAELLHHLRPVSQPASSQPKREGHQGPVFLRRVPCKGIHGLRRGLQLRASAQFSHESPVVHRVVGAGADVHDVDIHAAVPVHHSLQQGGFVIGLLQDQADVAVLVREGIPRVFHRFAPGIRPDPDGYLAPQRGIQIPEECSAVVPDQDLPVPGQRGKPSAAGRSVIDRLLLGEIILRSRKNLSLTDIIDRVRSLIVAESADLARVQVEPDDLLHAFRSRIIVSVYGLRVFSPDGAHDNHLPVRRQGKIIDLLNLVFLRLAILQVKQVQVLVSVVVMPG